MKKEEEITIINKTPPNGVVRWTVLWKILAALVGFAGWVYGIRVESINQQFRAQDDKIDVIVESVNEHIRVQNQNELKIAESLGEIKSALKIPAK